MMVRTDHHDSAESWSRYGQEGLQVRVKSSM
jgi:hypothetical protein